MLGARSERGTNRERDEAWTRVCGGGLACTCPGVEGGQGALIVAVARAIARGTPTPCMGACASTHLGTPGSGFAFSLALLVWLCAMIFQGLALFLSGFVVFVRWKGPCWYIFWVRMGWTIAVDRGDAEADAKI